jgi:hypothetical protein
MSPFEVSTVFCGLFCIGCRAAAARTNSLGLPEAGRTYTPMSNTKAKEATWHR